MVNPNALESLAVDSQALLVAHGRQKGAKFHVLSVEPASELELFKGHLNEAVAAARKLTYEWVAEAAKKKAKKNRKR